MKCEKKKRKDQIRTQNVTKFGLKMLTSSGLSTSNNWDWAETLKQFYTCRTWSLTQKWAVKSIGNKNDNTLKNDEYYSSRKLLQEDHEGSNWENREKLDWA
jgi:hypothetical protein